MTGMHFNNIPQNVPKTEWVRLWDCGVTWKDVNPAPDVYGWSRLDHLINLYSDRKILYVFAATPQWIAMNPNQGHFAPWLGPGTNSLPSDLDQWNKFVWQVVSRYKGRIHAYQIWNEPQLVDFMYPWTQSNRNRLATMTWRANRTIKSVDPKARVVSAAVLPRPSSGGMKRGGRYLSALRERGWPVDIVACHIYPEVGKRAKRWGVLLNNVRKSVEDMKGPKNIWVTETNYNLLGPVIPENIAGGLIRNTYQQAGNSKIFWYGWDSTSWLGGLNINHNTSAWNEIKRRI